MKTRRISLAASVAVASLLPLMTPTSANAFFHGSVSSLQEIIEMRIIQEKQDSTTDSVDGVKDEVKDVGDNLTEELRKGFGTTIKNLREALQGEARMKQLEDERSRQREIEREKVAAVKSVDPVISNPGSCEIVTRWHKTGSRENRPDLVLSEGTLASLEQMAALSLGGAIGESGTPAEFVSLSAKKQAEVINQASTYCSEAEAKAGLCTAPAPSEMQGASYVAAKSILKSNQFNKPEELQACYDFVKNMGVESGEDLDRISPKANPNGYDKIEDRWSYQARGSLAQTIALGYCESRALVSVSEDPTLGDGANGDGIISRAKSVSGFSNEPYVNAAGEPAMSKRLKEQFEAREWIVEHAKTLTEEGRIHLTGQNLGFMTVQLDDIKEKLDQQLLLLANQNSMTAEMLQMQKDAAQP